MRAASPDGTPVRVLTPGLYGTHAARLTYVVAAGCVVAVYYAAPSLRVAAATGLGVLSVAAIVVGVTKLRPKRRLGWVLLAAAVALLAAGNASFAALGHYQPAAENYPHATDALYLLVYPPLAIGLVVLGRPVLSSRDSGMLLDIIGLSLAGSLLLWIILVRPAIMTAELSPMGRVVAVGTWVGWVAVLAAGGRVAIDWYRNPALRLLCVGALAFLVADVLYGAALVGDGLTTGGLVDGGYQLFIVLAGAAALTPSMVDMTSSDHAHRSMGPVRLTLTTVAMLVAPSVLLVEATEGPVTTGVAIAIASAGLGILTVIRLALATRIHRLRTVREHAAQAVASELVAATTKEDVLASVDTALRTMLTKDAERKVHLAADASDSPSLVPAPPQTDLHIGQDNGLLSVPLPAPAAIGSQDAATPHAFRPAIRFLAPMPELVELAPTLEAIANQAGAALNRINLVARLRADERERYFRTLVLTSRDVTLISRRGRVEYATPSAAHLFGRDVRGDQLENLIEHRDDTLAVPGDGDEGTVRRADGSTLAVLARHRDLSTEPTVHGVVTTLRDVTAERRLQRDLAFRASHDQLTGLINASAFAGEVNRAADQRRPPGDQGVAILFVDLDDFKLVNDTYGHDMGDRLLEVVARRIESCLRAQDHAARVGGDEFAALLLGLPDDDAARAVAQRIADALTAPVVIDGIGLSAQASIGLSQATSAAASQPLLREADAALYTAKAHGKGRWAQYRAGMSTPGRRHINARHRIERGMSSGDLALHYQPVVALGTSTAVGFEALIRLNDDQPAMSPPELIRIADDTGLINELGAWTLRRALTDLGRLNSTTAKGRYVSVNVSARQLRQPDFVDLIRTEVAAAGVDPAMLVLEITEDLLVGDDYDRAWDFLAELRHDGIRIAIDDYGTGYASLSYLRQPGIDIVKIDQSFVADATTRRGEALLRYITGLCREIGLGLIAEGVGDAPSRDVLVKLGCEWGQGFYYAPALPVDEAAGWRFGVASPAAQ